MHTSVLLNELINGIFTKKDGIYVDCTGGGGGHSKKLLEKLSQNATLIVLDRDIDAISRLKKIFKNEGRVVLIHSSFSKIDNVLNNLNIKCVDGLYADFGLSNYQLSEATRGFSFMNNGKLDMRMNKEDNLSAYEIINNFNEEDIYKIIRKYGEEKFAKKIASNIVEIRKQKSIETTKELAEIISNSIPKKFHKPGTNPATKTFQAIRIYVNKELKEIETLLIKIKDIICKNGRVGFISFHSLEDKIVKNALKNYENDCICPPELPVCGCNKKTVFKLINKKAITPTVSEIKSNPLSRSAKLRLAEKVL